MSQFLARVRLVLVNTSHPGNIGAVARAMKNMGLSQLVLVAPQFFPHAEATARASGADDILASARVVESLPAAIADCALVVGASARSRTIRWPTLDARACATRMMQTVATDADVALVMGRENSGLSNAELDHCQYLVHIPSNPDYSSLNVAAAAQVLTYEIRMASLSGLQPDTPAPVVLQSEHPLATMEEMAGLYAHFEQALTQLGFLDPKNPRQLMRRLRRLFNRANLDRIELNILRGILSVAERGGKRPH